LRKIRGESLAFQGHDESVALAVVRETYVSRDDETLRVSNHNGKALLFEDGNKADRGYRTTVFRYA
jgi:hypothetical protein